MWILLHSSLVKTEQVKSVIPQQVQPDSACPPEQVLSLLSNAILVWNNVYISDIVTRLQGKGPNYL
jgi:hypothetical protein